MNTELEEVLDEMFPKGKCKKRGQALVLFAQAEMELERILQQIKQKVLTNWKGQNEFVNWLDNHYQRKSPRVSSAPTNGVTVHAHTHSADRVVKDGRK